MHNPNIHTSIGVMLAMLLSLCILGWLLYATSDTVEETVQVGGEGIRKAQEVKLEIESQSLPD